MISFKKKPDSEQAIRKIMHPLVEKWFFSKFVAFSEPQRFGIMEVHSRNNVLITAPTGGTKTLTAFLSILNELIDSSIKGILENKVYCVYVSPLKALSNDIQRNLVEPLQEMEKLHGKPLGINVEVRTGDTSTSKRSSMLKRVPHILITTPETLGIVLNAPKFVRTLTDVQWLIVDEIHSVAENKRGSHLALSMERLQMLSPGMCRVGLSATIAPIEEIAKFLVGYKDGKLRPCKVVDVQFLKKKDFKVISPVRNLIDTLYEVRHNALYATLHNLIQHHRTTLIFTNTRSGTERVVHHLKQLFPDYYNENNIGAHHGSLSKRHRNKIEKMLKEGKLKVAVSSTSLELGIDIGFIDLVVCLGSPKSVARFLQRAGRAGHRLHDTVKARMVVLDRDDLVECSVLLKAAIEGNIDRVLIPKNPLDVLAQHIYGIAINQRIHKDELYALVTRAYPYHTLSKRDFEELLKYLAGAYASLETRNVYGKITYYEDSGMIGRRGKLARVIYMTNIGTIPDQTGVIVKVGDVPIGKIEENFLEKLDRGDVFVLGGSTYRFLYARGQVAP
ncbi:DEAD/DEAH box helicase, partial [Candidatus Woesearchaeota archaeon]|nr:DEAD/DEAH box helicase [Candidatus Woesearchaeota archaeon]